ncbi:GNAT family N-acetyltransferase [Halobacillus salinus]|uniref:GNAT family N-acetyltransferase n=1 Tax=Halobacillus salinus TaxID=192814 RepID=UPI0009A8FFD1|nr:GNAT family N-acetyltransferase [Halobacillus salinus]
MIEVVEVQSHHLEAMHRWEMDETLQVKTGIEVPRTYEQFLDSYLSYSRGEKPHLWINVIELDGEPIGKIELYKTYIGIVLGSHRGEGYGAQALAKFIEKIKSQKELNHLSAEVYEDNPESINFFEKNSFRKTGNVTLERFRGRERKLIILERTL